MAKSNIAAVILAAGQGSRMSSVLPKVLHKIAGQPMINHVLAAVTPLNPDVSLVVIAPSMDAVATAVAPVKVAVQQQPLGTGDAVKAAEPLLKGFTGDILILFGDTPLIRTETLEAMLEARRGKDDPGVVVLGFQPRDPSPYGRLALDREGRLDRIVEAREASPEEKSISLCNSGAMAVDGEILFTLLQKVTNQNAKQEFYLTDIVALARQQNRICRIVKAEENELLGINDRMDLAYAEEMMQERLRNAMLKSGVTLQDPRSTWLSADTKIARDVVIEPYVFLGPGVEIGEGAVIHGFSYIENAKIAARAAIGPFARLRPGTQIGESARVGNFVEIKNTTLEAGAKANHLSYLGDAVIGAKANVGAGTITCNYDGFRKAKTTVGAGAFIGSNTALVAPVTIGAGAIVGAGSTITRDVASDAVVVARAPQSETPGAAARFRARRKSEKSSKA
ncbi:MAG: bifunctional UDP-N-acetylglucosamine diphosphorylase/glucosamine-1-phosphate N-acetyltransferase GlmU [Alphaproteobacteria bacterium]